MVVTRLVLHVRDIRSAIGPSFGPKGPYKAIITMLVESCALYTVSAIPFLGSWVSHSSLSDVFISAVAGAQVSHRFRIFPCLFFPSDCAEQVIASFLIILRVANRSAFTARTTISRDISAIHFQGKSGGDVPDGCSGSMGVCEESPPAESRVEVEIDIEEVRR